MQTEITVVEVLDALAEARQKIARLNVEYDALTTRAVFAAGLADEASDLLKAKDRESEAADKLEQTARAMVLQVGSSVKGTDGTIMAVYSAGSPKWDGARLDGYAAAHPEILVFKTPGKPSVAIRRIGGGAPTEVTMQDRIDATFPNQPYIPLR